MSEPCMLCVLALLDVGIGDIIVMMNRDHDHKCVGCQAWPRRFNWGKLEEEPG